MRGRPIEELNKGINLFYNAIKKDEVAFYAAEICIIAFGGGPSLIADFAPMNRQLAAPSFSANGLTPMGEAVNMALDCLERRKQEYRDTGVDYYQPWLVLMSDGLPEGGSQSELNRAVQRTEELVNNRKLTTYPFYVGEARSNSGFFSSLSGSQSDYDKAIRALQSFSPKNPVRTLHGLQFNAFFEWLSQSVSTMSMSTPGQHLSLDPTGDWSTLSPPPKSSIPRR
jgi:uncharacterized protein YegL